MVDGVSRLDEGAVLDDFFPCLEHVGVMALLAEAHGAGIQRPMLPFSRYVLLSSLKTLVGMERINALPALLCSDEALMPWVGCNARQVRGGGWQRGAATRQGERHPAPIGPDTLATNSVRWDLQPLEAVFNGAIRALAQAGVFGQPVTGIADGTDRETTEHDRGCGQATRTVRIADTHGQKPAMEVTVSGWNVLRLGDAATTIPLAVKVGPIQAHEPHWTRALVTHARTNLAGAVRLHQVVVDKGFWDGTDRWWLDQQRMLCVVPAKANMAVTADARAQAAAGEGLTIGRRIQTIRHGQEKTAWAERQETKVVGLTGLTTDDQMGRPSMGATRIVVISRATSAMPSGCAHGRVGTMDPAAKRFSCRMPRSQNPCSRSMTTMSAASSRTAASRQPSSHGSWAIRPRKRRERCGCMS